MQKMTLQAIFKNCKEFNCVYVCCVTPLKQLSVFCLSSVILTVQFSPWARPSSLHVRFISACPQSPQITLENRNLCELSVE